MIDSNVGVRVSMGPFAERPAPTGDGVAVDDLFTDIDTDTLYQLKRDQATGVLSWIQITGQALPFSSMAFSGVELQTVGAQTAYFDNNGVQASKTPIGYQSQFNASADTLYVNVETNGYIASALHFTLYVNGAPTLLTVAVPAGATGVFSDLVNAVGVVPGDRLDLVLTNAGSELASGLVAASATFLLE